MLLSVTFTLPTLAIRPLQKVWTVKQSDSTSIKILVHGEGGRTVFFTSLDGKIIVKGADNNFYHAIIRDGELHPSTYLLPRARSGRPYSRRKGILGRNQNREEYALAKACICTRFA